MADGVFQAVHTIPIGGIQITAASEADIAVFLDRMMGAMAGRDARNIQYSPAYSAQEAAERADEYVDLLGRIAASLESIELVMKSFVTKAIK
jgi:hypothetical protein